MKVKKAGNQEILHPVKMSFKRYWANKSYESSSPGDFHYMKVLQDERKGLQMAIPITQRNKDHQKW